MRRTIHFTGDVAANTSVTRTYFCPGGIWDIDEIDVVFLVGQAGTLFVRPMMRQICGGLIDLVFPDVELTGDDIELRIKSIEKKLNPGASLEFVFRNTSLTNARRYLVKVELFAGGAE